MSSSSLTKINILRELQELIGQISPTLSDKERNELIEKCIKNVTSVYARDPHLGQWVKELEESFKQFKAEDYEKENINILRQRLESLL